MVLPFIITRYFAGWLTYLQEKRLQARRSIQKRNQGNIIIDMRKCISINSYPQVLDAEELAMHHGGISLYKEISQVNYQARYNIFICIYLSDEYTLRRKLMSRVSRFGIVVGSMA